MPQAHHLGIGAFPGATRLSWLGGGADVGRSRPHHLYHRATERNTEHPHAHHLSLATVVARAISHYALVAGCLCQIYAARRFTPASGQPDWAFCWAGNRRDAATADLPVSPDGQIPVTLNEARPSPAEIANSQVS